MKGGGGADDIKGTGQHRNLSTYLSRPSFCRRHGRSTYFNVENNQRSHGLCSFREL